MSFSRAENFVRYVNKHDLMHRRGWRCSEKPHAIDVIVDLEAETLELHRALTALVAAEHAFENGSGTLKARQEAYDHAKEELADVLNCTLQVADKMHIPFPDLDAEAAQKMRARFIGIPAVLP